MYKQLMVAASAMASMVMFSNSAVAEDADVATEGNWSGNIELGYLRASGNTDNESFSAGIGLNYSKAAWVHGIKASALLAEDATGTTAERYAAGIKSQYNFTAHDYVFVTVDWEKDRFSGYDRRTKETIGYGRRLLANDRHMLNMEIGVGARQSELTDGTSESDVIGRFFLDYDLALAEGKHFDQSVLVESGESNTFIESISALRLPLTGGVGIKLSYTVRHNTEVPVDVKETDTLAAVNIDYAFD